MVRVVDRLRASGLIEADRPEGCPAMYSFHAYCRWENPEHRRGEFPHEADQVQTLREAKAQLRKDGWIFHDEDYRALATCPKCARRIRRSPASIGEGK